LELNLHSDLLIDRVDFLISFSRIYLDSHILLSFKEGKASAIIVATSAAVAIALNLKWVEVFA
jgi:hypothetical protein